MKTLKTLFLFLALVSAGNSFGQTKEETIEWLELEGMTSSFYKLDNGVSVRKNYEFVNDSITVLQFIDFPSGDTSKNVSQIAFKDILYYQDVDKIMDREYNEDSTPTIRIFDIITTSFVYYFDEGERKVDNRRTKHKYEFAEADEQIARRTLKAIMHLAKLSGAKEYKQTF
jgi:hypothetical protein